MISPMFRRDLCNVCDRLIVKCFLKNIAGLFRRRSKDLNPQ